MAQEHDFAALFDHAAVAAAVYEGDDHTCVYANAKARAFLGVDSPIGKPAAVVLRALGMENLEARFNAIASGAMPTEVVTVSLRSTAIDHLRFGRHTAQPWTASDGKIGGVMSLIIEVTAEAADSDARADMLELFKKVADASPEFIGISDANFKPVYGNPRALEMVEMELDDVLKTPVPDYFVEEERAYVREVVIPTLLNDGFYSGELHLAGAKTGRRIPILYTNFRVDSPTTGEAAYYATISRDLTEQRAADARQEALVAELDHRVKNTMAIIQSLARRTFANAGNDVHAKFEGRLQALAAAHRASASRAWQSASLGELVTSAPALQRAMSAIDFAPSPEISVSVPMAQVLALAVNELATNAHRYGALSGEEGRISLAWGTRPAPQGTERTNGDDAGNNNTAFELTWCETGGPDVAPTTQRPEDFGLALIKSAVEAAGGEVILDWRPTGLVCTIRGPLSDDTASANKTPPGNAE